MRIGDRKVFQDALDRTIFAERSVQRIEADVGPQLRQDGANIAGDVDAGDPIADLL